MGTKRLLDYDPETGTKSYLHSDAEGYVIQSIQDAEPIVEHNARMAEGLDKKKDWWFVGSIPLTLCYKWAQESNTKPFTRKWQEYAKKQMNHPDYRKLNPNKIKV